MRYGYKYMKQPHHDGHHKCPFTIARQWDHDTAFSYQSGIIPQSVSANSPTPTFTIHILLTIISLSSARLVIDTCHCDREEGGGGVDVPDTLTISNGTSCGSGRGHDRTRCASGGSVAKPINYRGDQDTPAEHT